MYSVVIVEPVLMYLWCHLEWLDIKLLNGIEQELKEEVVEVIR